MTTFRWRHWGYDGKGPKEVCAPVLRVVCVCAWTTPCACTSLCVMCAGLKPFLGICRCQSYSRSNFAIRASQIRSLAPFARRFCRTPCDVCSNLDDKKVCAQSQACIILLWNAECGSDIASAVRATTTLGEMICSQCLKFLKT